MSYSEQEQVIFVHDETTYGTIPANAATAAIICHDLDFDAYSGGVEERNNYTGRKGGQGSLRTGHHQSLSFGLDLTPSGTKDVPPPYAALLLASGHAETVTASTKVDYTPISSGYSSAGIYYYAGETLHKQAGWRSGLSLDLSMSKIPKLMFRGLGLYVAPEEAIPMAPDYTAFQKPKVVDADRVQTCTLDGVAVAMVELKIDLGEQPVFGEWSNEREIQLPKRNGTVDLLIREPAVDTTDWWAKAKASSGVALVYQLGNADGENFAISIPNVELGNLKREYRDDIAHLRIPGRIVPTTKNGDYTITYS